MKRILLLGLLAGVAYGQQPGDLVEVTVETKPTAQYSPFFGPDYVTLQAAMKRAGLPLEQIDKQKERMLRVFVGEVYKLARYSDNLGNQTNTAPQYCVFALLKRGEKLAVVPRTNFRVVAPERIAEVSATFDSQAAFDKENAAKNAQACRAMARDVEARVAVIANTRETARLTAEAAQQLADEREDYQRFLERINPKLRKVRPSSGTNIFDELDAMRYRRLPLEAR